jgi:hypothetical protein
MAIFHFFLHKVKHPAIKKRFVQSANDHRASKGEAKAQPNDGVGKYHDPRPYSVYDGRGIAASVVDTAGEKASGNT